MQYPAKNGTIDGYLRYMLDSNGNAVPAPESADGNGSGGTTSGLTPSVLQPGMPLSDIAEPIVIVASLTVISRCVFVNTTDTDVPFTVYRVAVGDDPSEANVIISRPILPYSSDLAPELSGMCLEPGDSIQAYAEAPGVNVFCSGLSG